MTLSKKQVRAKQRPENMAESLTNVDPWVPCSGLKQKKTEQPKQARIKRSQTHTGLPSRPGPKLKVIKSSYKKPHLNKQIQTNKPEKQLPGSFKQITPNPALVACYPPASTTTTPQLQSGVIYRSKQLALPQVV